MSAKEAEQMAILLSRVCGVPIEVGHTDTGQLVIRVVWPTGIMPLVSVRECIRYANHYQAAQEKGA